MLRRMHDDQIDSDADLVRVLLTSQLPQWAGLPIEVVESTGTDNALYRLGHDWVVRMPLRPSASNSIGKEDQWLPRLAPLLPLEIPITVARGDPAREFPWPWSVVVWIEGEDATTALFSGHDVAADVAGFLAALHSIDLADGPEPVPAVGRGLPLVDRDLATRWAIREVSGLIDADALMAKWESTLTVPTWDRPPVWVHGDLAAGNILLQDGRLRAVIDWGALAIGDPACDLIIAWEIFDQGDRDVFRTELGVDEATWARGRGWALSTAVMELYYYQGTNQFMVDRARRQLAAVLAK